MNQWIERLGLPSVVSALVGGLMGYWSANYVDQASKVRTAKLDQIVRFTAANDGLLSGISNYISTMADQKDILVAQNQLKAELSKQINESENLKPYFDSKENIKDVSAYQRNLVELLEETKEANESTRMVKWVGNLDKVLVSRKAVTASLLKSVGIGF